MSEEQNRPRVEGDKSYDREMTIVEHLAEFRTRLLRGVIALTLGTVVGFIWWRQLMAWLLEPAGPGQQLVTLRVQDNMLVPFKVSMIAGLVLSMPVIVYQLVMYLVPALTAKERRYLWFLVPGASVLFLIGILFSRYVVLPAALTFLLSFASDVFQTMLNVPDYVSFVFTLLLWVGLVFETPLIIYFLAKLNVVNTKMLTGFRRYAIVAAFIIAAVITPSPDPWTQMVVAVPLLVLYEVGVLLSRVA